MGAALLIGGLIGHPFTLFGFVSVVRIEGHDATVGPGRLKSLVKIEQCPIAAASSAMALAGGLHVRRIVGPAFGATDREVMDLV